MPRTAHPIDYVRGPAYDLVATKAGEDASDLLTGLEMREFALRHLPSVHNPNPDPVSFDAFAQEMDERPPPEPMIADADYLILDGAGERVVPTEGDAFVSADAQAVLFVTEDSGGPLRLSLDAKGGFEGNLTPSDLRDRWMLFGDDQPVGISCDLPLSYQAMILRQTDDGTREARRYIAACAPHIRAQSRLHDHRRSTCASTAVDIRLMHLVLDADEAPDLADLIEMAIEAWEEIPPDEGYRRICEDFDIPLTTAIRLPHADAAVAFGQTFVDLEACVAAHEGRRIEHGDVGMLTLTPFRTKDPANVGVFVSWIEERFQRIGTVDCEGPAAVYRGLGSTLIVCDDEDEFSITFVPDGKPKPMEATDAETLEELRVLVDPKSLTRTGLGGMLRGAGTLLAAWTMPWTFSWRMRRCIGGSAELIRSREAELPVAPTKR